MSGIDIGNGLRLLTINNILIDDTKRTIFAYFKADACGETLHYTHQIIKCTTCSGRVDIVNFDNEDRISRAECGHM